MELTQLSGKIHVKLSQFFQKYVRGFNRPEQKFIRQMLFGILKSGAVQLNAIGRALQEKIALKKTTQRLRAHLNKVGLWKRVLTNNLRTQRSYLQQCDYLVLDLSDIQKEYAEQMEGLAQVYDGSSHETGPGYWLCNVTGVDKTGSLIVPCYSELYRLAAESSSENQKILSAIETVSQEVGDDKIWVIDRGGDRRKIMEPLLVAERQFIIRQDGDRDLYLNGAKKPSKEISRSVKLTEHYRVTKRTNNKQVTEYYCCGAVPVKLSPKGQDLWLVVLKEQHKGYCWLLCHLRERSVTAVIQTAVTGYGHRWKIEEVHRQIKSDYQLEQICLQRYDALKAMNALLWTAVSFLYTRLDRLSIEIITQVELGLRNRKKWSDLIRFVYYKLAYAMRKLLAWSKLYLAPIIKSPSSKQLWLDIPL